MGRVWTTTAARFAHWTGSGLLTVIAAVAGAGGWQVPSYPYGFLPTACRMESGDRLGPLKAGSSGWLPLAARVVPPGTPLWIPGNGVGQVYLKGVRFVARSLAKLEDQVFPDDLAAPGAWGEGAPPSEPQPVIALAEPDGEVDGEILALKDVFRDLPTARLAILFAQGSEMATPVGILPELPEFIAGDHGFDWHGDAPPVSALCLPLVDGRRPGAPVFYSAWLREEVKRLLRQP